VAGRAQQGLVVQGRQASHVAERDAEVMREGRVQSPSSVTCERAMDAVILDPDLDRFFRRSYLQTSAHRSLATVMRPASLQGAVMTWNRAGNLGGLTVDTVFATIEFEGGFAHDEGGCPQGNSSWYSEHGSLTVSIWRCSRGRRGGDRRSGPGQDGARRTLIIVQDDEERDAAWALGSSAVRSGFSGCLSPTACWGAESLSVPACGRLRLCTTATSVPPLVGVDPRTLRGHKEASARC
jgi:hypothetical protein